MLRRSAVLAVVAATGKGPFVPHRILGVKPDASRTAVKARYIRLAKQYHPDMGGATADRAAFNDVSAAYKAMIQKPEANSKSQRTPPPVDDVALLQRTDFRYHEPGGRAGRRGRRAAATGAEPASGPDGRWPAGKWTSGLSTSTVVGASAAIPALLILDPCSGTIANAVFFGGLGAASWLAYRRFRSMRQAMVRLMRPFRALYDALRAGRSWTDLDATLRRWRTVFASWLHKGGEFTRFAKEMLETIDAARRVARRRRAQAQATASAGAAAAGSSSFASSAAGAGRSGAPGSGPGGSQGDAAPSSDNATDTGGPDSDGADLDHVEQATAPEPQVVTVTNADIHGGPTADAAPADGAADEAVMVTVPIGSDVSEDGAGGWGSSLFGSSADDVGMTSDDGDLVLVQLPQLSAAATASIETHCSAVAERMANLDAEQMLEVAATLPLGYVSTRLVFAGIRWLVNKACALLVERAGSRDW